MIVRGVRLEPETQCAHYHSERDVVAIRLKCCEAYYACLHCHEEMAGHIAVAWGKDKRETRAVLCGKCRQTLSITEYLGCGNLCPFCGAAFNPGCGRHYPAYFEM